MKTIAKGHPQEPGGPERLDLPACSLSDRNHKLPWGFSMFAWYSMLTFVVDAMEVIDKSLRAAAGTGGVEEKFLMVTEDLGSAPGSRAVFMRGDDRQILDSYRKIVVRNLERSSAE
jgi:hypothetical protein